MGWKIPRLHEYRLVPKVSQTWFPTEEVQEDEGETCVICLSGVPADHFETH